MDAQGFIVIGCCAVGCWSVLHVARRMWARHGPNRWQRHIPPPFSERLVASTPTKSGYSPFLETCHGSSGGTTVTIPPRVGASSSFTPLGLLPVAWETPRPRPVPSNWPAHTGYGSETDAPGASGQRTRSAACSPVAELWGDFEWEDAA